MLNGDAFAEINEDHNITPDWDIYMQGNVTWVGRSSIEVSMELWQDVNVGLFSIALIY